MSDRVSEAEAEVAIVERDIATLTAARADLAARLPALRAERAQAARSTLLAGTPRKAWQAACQAEQEAVAMLADVDVLAGVLANELIWARSRVETARVAAQRAALALRLDVVSKENGFKQPVSFDDVATAYRWLATVRRTEIDRKHACSFWLDRMSIGTRNQVPTVAFVLAVLCHGDIAVEIVGDHEISFGINEFVGRPGASLPLTGAPTPATNRSLIRRLQPSYGQTRRVA